MKERIRAVLEEDPTLKQGHHQSFWHRNGRPLLLVVGVAAAIAASVAYLPGTTNHTVNTTSADSTNTDTQDDFDGVPPAKGEPATQIQDVEHTTTLLRSDLALTLPQEDLGDWLVRSENQSELTIEFVPQAEESDAPSGTLRIIAPTRRTTTPDDVVTALGSTLFDTNLVSDGPGEIGMLDTRVVRLETEGGTTRLAFKVAFASYVQSEGEDRVFLVHVTKSEPVALVFWVEATPEHIDEFETIASRLVETVTLG